MHPRRQRPRRWWPGLIAPALGLAAIAANWTIAEREGQQRVMFTLLVSLLVIVLTALWVVGYSPLTARRRRMIAAALVLLVATGATLVRVRGVTGDFVPVLEWRWAGSEALPAPDPGAVAAGRAAPARNASDRDAGSQSTSPSEPGNTLAADAADGAAMASRSAPDQPHPEDARAETPDMPPVSPFLRASFPQFLGPDRNGVIRGLLLGTDWATNPPRLVWKHPVGPGWSGFAVGRGLAITQEQRGADEAVVAYDLATGAARWLHADPARYATVVAGEGPRATPAIVDGRVFSLGSTGLLNSLDTRTGTRLWIRDVAREHGGTAPPWGRSSSPLVLDGRVIVNAGGPDGRSLVAYDAATGALAWHGGSDAAGYASPMHVTLAGVPQVVAFNAGSVVGHDPSDGTVLWEQPWPGAQPNVAQPLRVGEDRLLVSSGYGIGAKLLRIARGADGRLQPEIVWESPRLKAKFTNLVLHGGFVYGLDDGVLVCLDLSNGERRWKSGRYGHGQVLLVGGLLLVQTEEGEIVLVRPQPDRHVELRRFAALEGKTWNSPTLAGRYLLVRNDREAAMYELPLR